MKTLKENMYYTELFEKKETKKRKWTSNFLKYIKRNKIISIIIFLFFLCVNVNMILIFKFLETLQFIK